MMMRNTFICLIIFSLCSFIYAEWQSIGPYGTNLRTMAQASTDENFMYTASYSNPTMIFKSTDAGDSWTQISEVQYWIYSPAIDPGAYLYATTYGAGMYRSPLAPGIYTIKWNSEDKNSTVIPAVSIFIACQQTMSIIHANLSG
ncbi:MAG: hypothetical protein WBB37_09555 [bacterium]